MRVGVIAAIVVIIIAICVIVFHKKAKKKLDEKKLDNIISGNDDDNDDDDETVLMRDEDDDDDATVMGKTLILTGENGGNKFECRCVSEISIGRKEICDIHIQGDKSVSGLHCIIAYDYDGNLTVRDNNSSNGTYLNDEKLDGERKLESGDTLEIGRTRYLVHIL